MHPRLGAKARRAGRHLGNVKDTEALWAHRSGSGPSGAARWIGGGAPGGYRAHTFELIRGEANMKAPLMGQVFSGLPGAADCWWTNHAVERTVTSLEVTVNAPVASRTDRCHLRKWPAESPIAPTSLAHPARLRYCYRFLMSTAASSRLPKGAVATDFERKFADRPIDFIKSVLRDGADFSPMQLGRIQLYRLHW